jgi:hypothetical protein
MYLDDKRYNDISKSIRKTYPNSCIIEIKEVINNDDRIALFLENYEKEYEKKLIDNIDTKIIELFHGTDEDSSYNIIDEGFMVSKNKVSAYGKGTYFSNSAEIAKSYAISRGNLKNQNNLLYVIIADIIISDMICGSGLHYGDKKIPSCYVNSLTSPSYFCIPHDNRALPKYIVSFYEN